MSPGWPRTFAEGLIARMASLVWSRVLELMSVMAILVHPERAKPLATAAPIPAQYQHVHMHVAIIPKVLAGSTCTSNDGDSKELPCN